MAILWNFFGELCLWVRDRTMVRPDRRVEGSSFLPSVFDELGVIQMRLHSVQEFCGTRTMRKM